MPDRAIFDAGGALGFPRLPLRPAVSVSAGREAWGRFTANGTEEDVAAAWIAVAACLDGKAHAGAAGVTPLAGQAEGSPDAEKAYRSGRCAFCGGSLAGRRRHARYCRGRCRAAAFRERERTADHQP